MSALSFTPSQVIEYGITGQDTARKMQEALASDPSLELTYDAANKRFTILGSAGLSTYALTKIFFDKQRYSQWLPKVLPERDAFGNRFVTLFDSKIDPKSVEDRIQSMISTAFNPSQVTEYGITGQDTARKMQEALASYPSLELTYDATNKRFTVLGSAGLSTDVLTKFFFDKQRYSQWLPKVLPERDVFGNRFVTLFDSEIDPESVGNRIPRLKNPRNLILVEIGMDSNGNIVPVPASSAVHAPDAVGTNSQEEGKRCPCLVM